MRRRAFGRQVYSEGRPHTGMGETVVRPLESYHAGRSSVRRGLAGDGELHSKAAGRSNVCSGQDICVQSSNRRISRVPDGGEGGGTVYRERQA